MTTHQMTFPFMEWRGVFAPPKLSHGERLARHYRRIRASQQRGTSKSAVSCPAPTPSQPRLKTEVASQCEAAGRPEAQFDDLFVKMYQLCGENGWGDPFSYARSREIHLANRLGHTVAKNYRGSDATDAEGNPVEYKSTIASKIKATYNGISVQPTWEAQETYLQTQKIGKYSWHYFARYEGGRIEEVWKMTGEKVLALLLPKIKKQYDSTNKRKDPRLGTSLGRQEIIDNATQVDL